MQKIDLKIVALSHSIVHTDNYAVVLGEKNGRRKLPIVIGAYEAQAIVVQLENLKPNRPLTHDLFINSIEKFNNIELDHVIINNLVEGVFYSILVFEQNGKLVEVDSRASDAIAIAMRAGCPIYTYDFIMKEAGVIFEDDEDEQSEAPSPEVSIETLEEHLQQAIDAENYEVAAKIRDEINKRKEA